MFDTHQAAVLAAAAVTPLGNDIQSICDALYAGKNAFSVPRHFDAKGLVAAVDHSLDSDENDSRASRLLKKLKSAITFPIPPDTQLFLSTTVGAIDRLENGENCDSSENLLETARELFALSDAVLISAACASGQTAVSFAMEQLAAGQCRYALVIGCDITSEFVTSGFTALGAVSKSICRPYDTGRDGLVLGEAAGALLLSRDGNGEGRILNAVESCDAAHITAPDLNGTILKEAIARAIAGTGNIGGIIGHGTGTKYNDLAEINALKQIFPENMPPLYSLKGNLGHTLGATGILQIITGLEFSRRGLMPPQANLLDPEIPAVSNQTQKLLSPRLLTLNVGFGGVNSALILEAEK